MGYDVSIVRCEDYRTDTVNKALTEAIEAVGGLEWVKPGMRVALKANLVCAHKKEAAATTHPTVLAELTRLLAERGAQVILGDSPGGLFNEPVLKRVYDITGMQAGLCCRTILYNTDQIYTLRHIKGCCIISTQILTLDSHVSTALCNTGCLLTINDILNDWKCF